MSEYPPQILTAPTVYPPTPAPPPTREEIEPADTPVIGPALRAVISEAERQLRGWGLVTPEAIAKSTPFAWPPLSLYVTPRGGTDLARSLGVALSLGADHSHLLSHDRRLIALAAIRALLEVESLRSQLLDSRAETADAKKWKSHFEQLALLMQRRWQDADAARAEWQGEFMRFAPPGSPPPGNVGYAKLIRLSVAQRLAASRDSALREAEAAIASRFSRAENDDIRVGLGMAGNAVQSLRARSASPETPLG